MIKYETKNGKLYNGNCLKILKELPDDFIQMCVTSPPYWKLRDYKTGFEIWDGDTECNHMWTNNFCKCGAWYGSLGAEPTSELFIEHLVQIFSEVKRIMKPDGTLWLNIGDKMLDKSLQGIPWRLALALKNTGWILRSEIIWYKNNALPEPASDRPTRSHEHIFLLSKNQKYYYDFDAVKEKSEWSGKSGAKNYDFKNDGRKGGKVRPEKSGRLILDNTGDSSFKPYMHRKPKGYRNKRTVWEISTKALPEAHFAVFPEELIKPCIEAGSPKKGVVLDPFFGSGTVGVLCEKLDRNWLGIELSEKYCEIAEKRLTTNKESGFISKKTMDGLGMELEFFPENP